MPHKPKKIITIFAGRQPNLEILIQYLKKALELNIIDEVHFWNNTRNLEDETYLKTITNLKRISSNIDTHYIPIYTPIVRNSFTIDISASNDIHIQIKDTDKGLCLGLTYEIVLGGRRSIIQQNGVELICVTKPLYLNSPQSMHVAVVDNTLCIYINNALHMEYVFSDGYEASGIPRVEVTKKKENFTIRAIALKTGYNSVGDVHYETIQNHGFYLMDTCIKSWQNYYMYYTHDTYKDDILIKCDDDIVFIDLKKLPDFITFIQSRDDCDLVFANTINNGVSAFYQQHKYGLIPTTFMHLEYPDGGFCGSLWESGKKAEDLHHYFIEHCATFLTHEYNKDIIPIETRFSINFFGYKGKNWHRIQEAWMYGNDEYNLTVDYVKHRHFKNVLYTDFYVSHLSFCKQIETGINLAVLQKRYHDLYLSLYAKKGLE